MLAYTAAMTTPSVLADGSRLVPLGGPGRLLRIGLLAGAVGALSLVEPRRLGPVARAAYRVGVASVSGVIAADTARTSGALLDPIRDGVLTGGVTLGMMDLAEAADALLVDGLHRAGLAHPRPLLAALGAAGTVAAYALPGSVGVDRWGALEEVFAESETTELPAEVRALLETLLAPGPDGEDLPGAHVLREQLATVRAVDPGYPTSDVPLHVPEPRRRAVPHQQTWPVTGRFRRGGIEHMLELTISEGALAMLSVMLGPEASAAGEDPRLDRILEEMSSPGFLLPEPGELELRRESEG